MTERNKNRKKALRDFLRYRQDEMTGEERNSFEREQQKDPFAEESSEGFDSISPEQASKDMAYLQKSLRTRINRRQGFKYYRIAASVAVLMVISTLFMIVERNKSGKQLSETAGQFEALEITVNKPITDPAVKEEVSGKPVLIAEKKTEKSVTQQKRPEAGFGNLPAEDVKADDVQIVEPAEEKKPSASRRYVDAEKVAEPQSAVSKEKISSEIRAKGKVLSSEDNMPVPGASVLIKGTNEEEVLSGYVPPKPVKGKAYFDKYIRENMQRSDTTTAVQRVAVVVSFHVLPNGSIDSIRIIRSPDKLFSDEAIRLIKTGPSWKPAVKNGEIIEDEVRVRIIFNILE